jgi:hypothetical protein
MAATAATPRRQPTAVAASKQQPSTSIDGRRPPHRRRPVVSSTIRRDLSLWSDAAALLPLLLLLLLLVTAATAPAPAAAAPAAAGATAGVIAPARSYSLPPAALPQLPVWVRNRSADIVLDFSKADPRFALDWRYRLTADVPTGTGAPPPPQAGRTPQQQTAHVPFRGRDLPVLFPLGHFHGNVAVVRFADRLVAAVRKMYFFKTTREQIEGYPKAPSGRRGHDALISWWGSSVAICDLDRRTLQPTACADFDPRPWTECLWSQGFEGTGVEDPRLIVWPGRGLYVMFGSKPWAIDPSASPPTASSTACDGPWAFQPWLMLLQPYGDQPDPSDPWSRGIIRLSYVSDEDSARISKHKTEEATAVAPLPPLPLLKEKNWNPFVFKGRLLFSQQFDPHVVIEPYPNGTCVRVFETPSPAFARLPSKPRGNTQAVLVPAAFSGERRDYYLGVVHAEQGRAYLNYFYKMQAHPPFRIYRVSAPMPIVNGQQPRNPAWTDVSFPMSLDLLQDAGQVLVGYGSGDKQPRVLVMPWEDVRALFVVGSSDGDSAGGGGGAAGKGRR